MGKFTDELLKKKHNPKEEPKEEKCETFHNGGLDNPEDPPEEVTIKKEIISVDDWARDWEEGARAKADRWKRKVSTPYDDPTKLSIEAKDKWWNRLEEARRLGLREAMLKAVGFTGWGEAIAKTEAGDYSRGIERKAYKFKGKIARIRDLVNYLKARIKGMADATPEDRERRITSARKGMLVVGLLSKGIIDMTEARRRIDELTPQRRA